MEVFSGAAAAITLGVEVLHLSKWLFKTAKKIKYARREITKLAKEMAIFSDFYRVCISGQKRGGYGSYSTRRLVAWAQNAKGSFEKLLKRVRVLAGDSEYSKLETLKAHMKWYFSENEVKCLRSSLSVARESMRGFSNITIIEKIDKEMDLLRAAIAKGDRRAIEEQLGMTVEEKMEELKHMKSVSYIQRNEGLR